MAKKSKLQFTFAENSKRGANLPATPSLNFESLGDFIEERDRIKRAVEIRNQAQLKVDYSDFSKHVFFDSAESKLTIAKNRILNKYPFNGNSEELNDFNLTGSGYENYILQQWPRDVSYVVFNGTSQYISATDGNNNLWPSSSSLYVSAWVNPYINGEHCVVNYFERNSNVLAWSEHFDQWTKVNLTATLSSSQTDPLNGNNNVWKIIESNDGGAAAHSLRTTSTLKSGTLNVFSIHAKNITERGIALQYFPGSTDTTSYASFDLINGVVGSTSGDNVVSSQIEALSDGWYRCLMLFTASSSTSQTAQVLILSGAALANTYTGKGLTGSYIFGAQMYKFYDEGIQDVNSTSIPYLITSGAIKEDDRLGYHLYFSGTTSPHVKFNLFSGSQVGVVSSSYVSYTGSFNNVAVIYDNPADLLSLYINGNKTTSASVSFGSIATSPKSLYIASGSRRNTISGTFLLYSGSLDEVRILHTASDLWHKKNYSRPITSENYVQLYYTFNEGATGISSVDNSVIDYSKSGIHGKIQNYTSACRVSGATMLQDTGNPILYDIHSRVVSFSSSLVLSASLYDLDNNNNIFNHIAEGVLREDDNLDGILRNFSLAMARFFDEIKLYIDQFTNIKITNYDNVNESPDLFLPLLKKYFGWKISEHFDEANPLAYLFGEGVLQSGSLEKPLIEIRNQFWRRVLNNLPLLLKSKGTRSNLNHLFNVFGINQENFSIKEYGYLPGSSIQDERINKQKVQNRLAIGTGSISSSFVKVSSLVVNGPSDFTTEMLVQLPYPSASFTASLLSGALWQFQSGSDVDGFRLYYVRDSLVSLSGKIVFESGSTTFSSSRLPLFDGNFINIAAGRSFTTNYPFIKIRKLENSNLTLNQDFSGTSAFNINAGTYDFIIGANSGSIYTMTTQGHFGEVRYWSRELSGSEINDHTYNFQSVGVNDPLNDAHSLVGHWPLNEYNFADTAGILTGVLDLSRNGYSATGLQFPVSVSPYNKFLHYYNFLSPLIDLKWSENKIRIRDKTELGIKDVATDTNEVSLEFNLVDALNEDIVKIFATLDILNNAIGQPICKYRDEYSNLDGLRRNYFNRLGDSLNFSQFFDLFKWFDNKINESIKQLLPARVHFIGGEQVVESHMLERPRYQYQYPVFRTPQELPETSLSMSPDISGKNMSIVNAKKSIKSSYPATIQEQEYLKQTQFIVSSRDSSVEIDAAKTKKMIDSCSDGDERYDLGNHGFYRKKISGDDGENNMKANTGINFKNEKARETLKNNDRDN